MSDAAPSPTLLSRARTANPLPEGTVSVGVGLLLNGLGAYLFLALAGRALDEQEFNALAVLWTVTFLLAPGLFLPVEQEVSRTMASRRACNEGASAVVRQSAMLGGALFGVACLLVVVTLPWLYDLFFDEQPLLVVGFVLALGGYCVAHLVRGVLAGQARFRGYALYFGAEGAARVVIGALFLGVGVGVAGPFGLALGLVPFVAVAVAMAPQRDVLQPGPPTRAGEITASLGALLAGSLFTALMLNSGPLAVEILAGPDESTEAGRFLAGLLVARIPLFLFQAVQAALLPKLALLAGGHHWDEFLLALRRLLASVGALAAAGTLIAWAIGPQVVQIAFGESFVLGHRDLALLALSSGIFMLAVSLGQSLIAVASPARMAIGWATGVATFAVVTALGNDLYLRVQVGMVAGTTAVACVLGAMLIVRVRELKGSS
ncbi:MAG: lipopolysaccharide biosynthesis protein [Acidimicrobiales bacterium]